MWMWISMSASEILHWLLAPWHSGCPFWQGVMGSECHDPLLLMFEQPRRERDPPRAVCFQVFQQLFHKKQTCCQLLGAHFSPPKERDFPSVWTLSFTCPMPSSSRGVLLFTGWSAGEQSPALPQGVSEINQGTNHTLWQERLWRGGLSDLSAERGLLLWVAKETSVMV